MGLRALVEAVDLELEPVVAEVEDQVPLEQPRGLVGETTAAEVRMHRERAEVRDPAALVGDLEAHQPGRLPVELDHEAAELLRLRCERSISSSRPSRSRGRTTAMNGSTSSCVISSSRKSTSSGSARRIETAHGEGRCHRLARGKAHRAGTERDAAEDEHHPGQLLPRERLAE
jgi:hypothetical protein